jgi:UDP-glucose 4-epimerase
MMDGSLDVLVTGGAGFIGSHVVDCLLASGHRPRIFDLRPSPWHEPGAVDTRLGDLADLPRLQAAMAGCDAVVHLAAAADVNEVRDDPVDAVHRNASGTLHVLEAARRATVGRVVYASTIWVYSDTEANCHEEDAALCAPAHLYTATKLAGELYCRSYRELYGLESTVLRFGIPYGPRARPAAVVPAFVGRALAGEPLTIAGDGRQSRRFVYVEDLADGVVRALAPVAANRTYNLVGNEDTTIAEIAETVRELVGGVEIVSVPGRAGDFAGAPVSGERAGLELDWRPRTSFREGVARYVDWHRAQSAPPVRASARRSGALVRLSRLSRRLALAVVFAATLALMVLGVATILPVDEHVDAYDTLAATLMLLLPLVLAGGFAWDPEARRWVRSICAAIAVGDLVFAHSHSVFAVTAAMVALCAAPLARERSALAALLATSDG